jgi:photosystem II stability/assembly factor-like uncharacterized protein
MKMKSRAGLPLLLLLLAAVPALAGVNRWTPFGPGRGVAQDFALRPGSLYVLVTAPFVTHDDGESWTWLGFGLPAAFYEGSPSALAADPAAPGVLYVANRAAQVYRSVDDGRSWTFRASILDGAVGIHDLAVMGGTLYAGGSRGLFRSLDGGLSWSGTDFGGEIEVIVPDPTDPETLYLGGAAGVFRSTDGGETWSFLLDVRPAAIQTLAVSSDSSALYAGEPDENVYASADRGATWTKTSFDGPIQGLAVDPGSPSRAYVSNGSRLFATSDGGATWDNPSFADGRLAADPSRPGTIYALSYVENLTVSRDHGSTWSRPLLRGFGAPATSLLKRNPDEPSVLVLCRDWNYCVYSRDAGRTWGPFLTFFHVVDVAFDPRDPTLVYAVLPDAVWQFRTDRGTSDGRLPLDAQRARGLKAMAVSGKALILAGDYGAYRSTDGGRSWKDVLPFVMNKATIRYVESLVQDPEKDSILYALAHERSIASGKDRRVLYQSLDGGVRWRPILDPMRVLAVDPSRTKTLYAVRGSELLRSRDRGATWTLQGSFPTGSVRDLAVHPRRPSVLLAATDGSGVLISEDAGRSWAPFNAGLARQGLLRILKVTADTEVPGRFFAIPFSSEIPPRGGVFEATVE